MFIVVGGSGKRKSKMNQRTIQPDTKGGNFVLID